MSGKVEGYPSGYAAIRGFLRTRGCSFHTEKMLRRCMENPVGVRLNAMVSLDFQWHFMVQ